MKLAMKRRKAFDYFWNDSGCYKEASPMVEEKVWRVFDKLMQENYALKNGIPLPEEPTIDHQVLLEGAGLVSHD